MIYAVIAFVLYFLFSWPRIKKSYLLQAMLPELEIERKESEHKLLLEIDRLHSDRALIEQQIRKDVSKEYEEKLHMEGVKNLNLQEQINNMRWANKDKKAPDPDAPDFMDYMELKSAYKEAQNEISDLEETVYSLKSEKGYSLFDEEEYKDLKKKLDEKTKQLKDALKSLENTRNSIISLSKRHSDLLSDYYNLEAENSRLIHDAIRCIREETWGGLLRLKSSEKYNLPSFRQAQIKFPFLAAEKVFYLGNRKTFHAVPWCYTLDKANQQLKEMDIFQAIDNGYSPCSKCVDPEAFSDYIS